MAFSDAKKADFHAGDFLASGYTVIRIDKPDMLELVNPVGVSSYWYSGDYGAEVDFILLIATTDKISCSQGLDIRG
jgi:hypothetical protein